MKKILIILIIILFIIGLGIGYKKYRDYERIKNAIIKVELNNDLDVVYNTKVKVSDFIKSINGKIIDDYYINTGTMPLILILLIILLQLLI